MKNKGKKHVINYTLNPSSQLLVEDALKRCLAKSKGIGYRQLISKEAPRNKHSPFGDFPLEYMPKKADNFETLSIDSHQVANAVTSDLKKETVNKLSKTFNKALVSQKQQKVSKAPRAGALDPRKITVSDFRLHYDRGDLPILIEHVAGTSIKWDIKDFEKFDYQLYLPIFVDGIREKFDPYRFLAIQGTFYLLDRVGDSIVKVIPQLILPLKNALNTRDTEIISITLKVIQKLVTSSTLAGEALVPYYRQLLPIFNLYRNFNRNIGDKIDYNQRKKGTLGDLIQETLEIMEINGGDDAFINIKYMIPTYESCIYDIKG